MGHKIDSEICAVDGYFTRTDDVKDASSNPNSMRYLVSMNDSPDQSTPCLPNGGIILNFRARTSEDLIETEGQLEAYCIACLIVNFTAISFARSE